MSFPSSSVVAVLLLVAVLVHLLGRRFARKVEARRATEQRNIAALQARVQAELPGQLLAFPEQYRQAVAHCEPFGEHCKVKQHLGLAADHFRQARWSASQGDSKDATGKLCLGAFNLTQAKLAADLLCANEQSDRLLQGK